MLGGELTAQEEHFLFSQKTAVVFFRKEAQSMS